VVVVVVVVMARMGKAPFSIIKRGGGGGYYGVLTRHGKQSLSRPPPPSSSFSSRAGSRWWLRRYSFLLAPIRSHTRWEGRVGVTRWVHDLTSKMKVTRPPSISSIGLKMDRCGEERGGGAEMGWGFDCFHMWCW